MTHSARIQPMTAVDVTKPEAVVAIMGPTGSGKSTFINIASGSRLSVSDSLKSCTTHPQTSQPFELDGRLVTLIDTPGFDDSDVSDTDILKMIGLYLSTTYQSGLKLAGVIYFHRISDFRMGGISRKNFNMFRKLCGDDSLKNVVIVTNMWAEVSLDKAVAREAELVTDDSLFKPAIDKGAKVIRHSNTRESAHNILRQLINQRPEALRIQQELVDQKMDITETGAGVELDRQLAVLLAKHNAQLAELQEDMAKAIAEKDLETRSELDHVRRDLEGNIAQLAADRDRISVEFAQDRMRAEEKLRDVAEALETEQAARVERQREIERLLEESKETSRVTEEERADMRRQIDEIRRQPAGGFFSGLGLAIDRLFGHH